MSSVNNVGFGEAYKLLTAIERYSGKSLEILKYSELSTCEKVNKSNISLLFSNLDETNIFFIDVYLNGVKWLCNAIVSFKKIFVK